MVMSALVFASTVELNGAQVLLVPFVISVLLGMLVVVPVALYRKWYFYRRRLKKQVITAEYEPPLGFNPAEIGYMFDGKLGEREIAGTIIWLVQKGYLHIKKVDGGKRIFAGPNIDENLKTYEKKLIAEADVPEGATADMLLGRFMTYKSKIVRTNYAPRQLVFTQLVHSDLQRRQYVPVTNYAKFFVGAFRVALLLATFIYFVPMIIAWILITVDSGTVDIQILLVLIFFAIMLTVFTSIPFFIAGCVLQYIRGRILGRQWIVTPKLARMWPQIVGFREYVKLVENERLEFYSEQLETTTKNDLLPYAVALGFVKNWRKIIS
jgi:hypothetical protein